jgi:photosystem II stability/assembly factor-like uncharacterized protein
MKAGTIVWGLVLIFAGCNQEPKPVVNKKIGPTEIEGLELSFRSPYESTLITGALLTIKFTSESTGYLSTNDGSIYQTRDGARSWAKQKADSPMPVYGFSFINDSEGWAVGGRSNCNYLNAVTGCIPIGALVLHTKDAGQTWESVTVPGAQPNELTSVFFINSNVGFAVGKKSIIRTTNAGVTWDVKVMNDISGDMRHVRFFDEMNGLILSTWGIMLRTTDGGDSWEQCNFPIQGGNSLTVTNSNIAFAATGQAIQKSSDLGKTWHPLPAFPRSNYEMVFLSETTGLTFGSGVPDPGNYNSLGSIYYTVDGGKSWKGSDKIKEMEIINSADFPTSKVGYAISMMQLVKITID